MKLGTRYGPKLIRSILSRVAFVCSLMDQDGIQVRFLNSRVEGNNITSEQQALQLVSQVKFSGELGSIIRGLERCPG